MAVKSFKPYSPSRRFITVASFDEITTNKPERSLVAPLKSKAGRNQQGKLTVRHQGGGHKRLYRIIDFKRTKDGVPAVVATIEYDPNRSARIALLNYVDGEKRYIIAPNHLKVGDKIIFCDMAIYSMVKNNTFNGMPLPDIAVLHEDDTIEVVKSFGYEDFKMRLS